MTPFEIGLVFVPLLVACACLLWFTLGCLKDIPKSEQLECHCQPPMLIPEYFNNVVWRCNRCDRQWKIQIDLKKSRRDYRQWVLK